MASTMAPTSYLRTDDSWSYLQHLLDRMAADQLSQESAATKANNESPSLPSMPSSPSSTSSSTSSSRRNSNSVRNHSGQFMLQIDGKDEGSCRWSCCGGNWYSECC